MKADVYLCVSVRLCTCVHTLLLFYVWSLSLQIYKIRDLKKFFSIFIRVYLLYNVVLVSTVQHRESAVVVIQ